MPSLPRLALLAYVLSAVSVCLMLLWCARYHRGFGFDSRRVFNFHPALMTVAWTAFTTQAVLAYRALPLPHAASKLYHAVMHSCSGLCAALALAAVVYYHNVNRYPHLSSLHSWCGLMTVSLFLVNYSVGLITFLYPRLAPATRAAVLPFHSTLGLVLTVLPTLTASLGILERSTWTQAAAAAAGEEATGERLVANCLGIALLLTMCSAVAALVHRDSRRQQHWQEECGTGEEGRVRAEGEEEGEEGGTALHQSAAAPLLDEMVTASLAQLERQRRASREHRDREADRPRAAAPAHYGSTHGTQPQPPSAEQRQPAAAQASRETTAADSADSGSETAPSMWFRFKGVGPQGVILQSP